MKLVLYSGGQERSNRLLHQALVDLAGTKGKKRMTYIPFCADGASTYFHRFARRYTSFGGTDFHCLPADLPFTQRALSKALNSDIIYLAGGNTYYFLKHLRKSGLLHHLTRFARQGGVLAGLSAGALILTPSIRLAAVPKFSADPNEVKLDNLKGLGLVPFEFSPHYSPHYRARMQTQKELIRYSKKYSNPVYACEDGGGIILDTQQGRFEAIGRIEAFHRGNHYRMT